MLPSENLNRKGFTLVEIILALMIVSIMAGFLTVYFDVSFQNGGAAVSDLQKSLQLHSVMEKITADYSNGLVWKEENRYRVGVRILTSGGWMFEMSHTIPTSGTGGISGSIEPSWPTVLNNTVDDGECKWKNIGSTPANILDHFKNNIDSYAYAWYDGAAYQVYVPETDYVKFPSPGYTETSGTVTDILKVTLINENGERLTAYFPP